MSLKAPFVYFGGKYKIAAEVWRRLGADVGNYIEPFCGSAAVLLKRPGFIDESGYVETINDADGMASNFWRALKAEPEKVAELADWPVNENDLVAKHIWLVNRKESLQKKLEGNPEFYDAKIAGWWVWGMALWIGGGFCSGNGPWNTLSGELANIKSNGKGVERKKPHLGNNGRGVRRQLPYLSGKGQSIIGRGVERTIVSSSYGATVSNGLIDWMQALANRLRHVRVCCGDWGRVVTPAVTTASFGPTAVFLDPPYSGEVGRDNAIYSHENLTVSEDVFKWAIANGDNPLFRLAVCGYEGEHPFPDTWEKLEWAANLGYAGAENENRRRERVWFSPHCIREHFLF